MSLACALTGSSIPVFWLGLIVLSIFYADWVVGAGPVATKGPDPPSDVTGFYTVDSLMAGDFGLFWATLQRLILPAFVLGYGA